MFAGNWESFKDTLEKAMSDAGSASIDAAAEVATLFWPPTAAI